MPADPSCHLAVIEITSNCNLTCRHCYNIFNKNKIISIPDFKKIVCNELKKIGVDIITISGGEPLLLGEKIGEYIKTANKFFNEVNITTNGTLINKNILNSLRGVNIVQVSLDGPKFIHEKIRGRGTFEKTINGIKLLKENKIKTSTMTTFSDFNINYLIELHKILKQLNIPFGFERITNVGRGKKFNFLSKENTKKLFTFSKKYKLHTTDPLNIIKNKIKAKYLMDNKIMSGCSAGIFALCIDANLNVLPCARLRLKLGNLKNKTLRNILKNSEIIKCLKKRNLGGKCKNCNLRFVCGGCRAMSYSYSGNYLGEDKNCFYK